MDDLYGDLPPAQQEIEESAPSATGFDIKLTAAQRERIEELTSKKNADIAAKTAAKKEAEEKCKKETETNVDDEKVASKSLQFAPVVLSRGPTTATVSRKRVSRFSSMKKDPPKNSRIFSEPRELVSVPEEVQDDEKTEGIEKSSVVSNKRIPLPEKELHRSQPSAPSKYFNPLAELERLLAEKKRQRDKEEEDMFSAMQNNVSLDLYEVEDEYDPMTPTIYEVYLETKTREDEKKRVREALDKQIEQEETERQEMGAKRRRELLSLSSSEAETLTRGRGRGAGLLVPAWMKKEN